MRSAKELENIINGSVHVVPGLAETRVAVVRLPQPTADGCNWAVRHAEPRVGVPLESLRLLKDIIADARRHFNLWDVH